MIIGVPKEIKNSEFRVGLTPKSVAEITSKGHDVFVESNSGLEIGYTNKNYENSGAKIINSAEEVYRSSELIVKVK
jgi:alanine dehydrogenase